MSKWKHKQEETEENSTEDIKQSSDATTPENTVEPDNGTIEEDKTEEDKTEEDKTEEDKTEDNVTSEITEDAKTDEPIIAEAVVVESEEHVADFMDMQVKNPRMGKVLSLQEETERQRLLEQQRSKRIRQEQEYINQMIDRVEENLKYTREEQQYNEEFEKQIRTEVYRMHGISEDKLEGMEQSRRSWYQGAAFALFFLSVVMIVLCGVLHGFGSEICIFMAFFTAIEGTLLSNGRKQNVIFEWLIKVLYLLLFPMMMVVFVCYELGFEEYTRLVPVFTVAGVLVLLVGAISYFIYDPYRVTRGDRRRANSYIHEIEKAATKEVRLKEKALARQQKKQAKAEKRKSWHTK